MDDDQLRSDVQKYGWLVMQVPEKDDTPGWAFSMGLHQNFNHPEVVVFGLNSEVMQFVINSIGEEVREGKSFIVDELYPDLIEAYSCTFKPVNQVWYRHFLGYANWFNQGQNYPALQCVWPDKNKRFPWESQFNPDWVWAQPLLFHEELEKARVGALLESMAD